MLSPWVDLEAAIFAAEWVGERRWLPCPWLANTDANELPSSMALSTSTMNYGVDEGAANANDDVSPAEEAFFVTAANANDDVTTARRMRFL